MENSLAIDLERVVLDFPLKRGGPSFLKESMTGRFRQARKGQRFFRALDGIDLEVERGSVLGIVGPNGAGKSTLLRVIAGIYPPDDGVVRTRGRIRLLSGVGTGFQGDLTGRENIHLNSSIMGLSRQETTDLIPDILAFSGIEPHIDQPLRTYSSGMRARLGFAIAAHLEPDILLIDEVLSVGDASFRERSRERIEHMVKGDATVVIVSHSASTLRELCDRVLFLAEGTFQTDGGDVDASIEAYQNWAPAEG